MARGPEQDAERHSKVCRIGAERRKTAGGSPKGGAKRYQLSFKIRSGRVTNHGDTESMEVGDCEG